MLFQHFDWDLMHWVLLLHFAQPSYELDLRDQPWRYITDICNCKLSAKVSLMLDNPFSVLSLCKLNHISLCFIHISTKITCKQLILDKEGYIFVWSDPWCFGLLSKFQHNTEISIKAARVSRLSISCDYDYI